MLNLELAKYQYENIEDIVNLVNSVYRDNKSNKAWTSESHLLSGKRIDVIMFRKILDETNSEIYIAKLENNIIGCIQAKLENQEIHIGLFAVDSNFQSEGIGKRLLEFAESESSKLWKVNSFVMEVISNRKELIEFYIRRGYVNTNLYLDFPESELWNKISDDFKLLVLRKRF